MMFFFFFNDTATTEIYTLSLHDALPVAAEHCHARRPFESCCNLSEFGDALGCLKNVEIGAGEHDLRRQCFDRIGTRAQSATLFIQHFQYPAPARNPLCKLRHRTFQLDTHAIAVRNLSDRVRHVRGDISGKVARCELWPGRRKTLDATYSKCAPIFTLGVPGDEIPEAPGVRQPHRLDRSRGHVAGTIPIVDT